MKAQPLISVIVPIYNVEKYLERCINSILNQTYTNLEIILVNDGSPDDCGDVCDQYALKDNRIKVIHKENGGLSDARNVALAVMSGEYVTFIDSDDYVSPYYVEHLWEAIIKADCDLASSCFKTVFNEFEGIKEINRIVGYRTLTSEQCLEKMLYQDCVDTCATTKLYKKDCFKTLRYPKGKLYEDIPVTYQAIKQCKKMAIIENEDYYYRQRGGSIQYENFSSAKMDAIVHMQDVIEDIANEYPQLLLAAKCRCFSIACNLLFQITDRNLFQNEFEVLWNIIVGFRKEVLLDRKGRKKSRMAAAMSYLGYGLMKAVYCKVNCRGRIRG